MIIKEPVQRLPVAVLAASPTSISRAKKLAEFGAEIFHADRQRRGVAHFFDLPF
jgi:hypothetical protein